MNKVLKFGIGGVMVIGILLMAWTFLIPKTSDKKDDKPHYNTVTVEEQEPLLLEGNVENEKEVAYAYDPQKGDITSIKVANGQEVTAGEVLFEYANEALSEEIADMQRQLSRLIEENAVLNEELSKQVVQKDEIEAKQAAATTSSDAPISTSANTFEVTSFDQAIETTQKSIREIDNNIEDLQTKIDRLHRKSSSVITADIDGIVTLNEEGKTNPQIALVKLTSNNSVIRTTISEYDYESVSKGEKVTIYVKAQDRDIKGQVSFISNEPLNAGSSLANNATTSPYATGGASSAIARYAVMVTPEDTLPNGFTVQVKAPQKGIIIVEQAVQKEGEQEYVFVEKEGVAHRQNIKRMKRGVQWIVTEGLSIGDTIIMNPDDHLQDGLTITSETSSH